MDEDMSPSSLRSQLWWEFLLAMGRQRVSGAIGGAMGESGFRRE